MTGRLATLADPLGDLRTQGPTSRPFRLGIGHDAYFDYLAPISTIGPARHVGIDLPLMGRMPRVSGTGILQAFIGTTSWIGLIRDS